MSKSGGSIGAQIRWAQIPIHIRLTASLFLLICSLSPRATATPPPVPAAPPAAPPLSPTQVIDRVRQSTTGVSTMGRSFASPYTEGGSSQTPVPDLFTGSASNRIEIPVPTGRAGLQPSISIQYSSSNQENSLFGYGWFIALGSIQKVSNRNVDPTVEYQYAGPMGALDLVKVSVGVYRPKIESGYSQFQEVAGPNGLHWLVHDKSGNTSIFGETAAQRITSPTGAGPIYWALSEVADRSTNYSRFSYVCDGGSTSTQGCTGNTLVPNGISYAGNSTAHLLPSHCVLFKTESRPDRTPVARAGQYLGLLSVRINGIETYPLGGPTCSDSAMAGKAPEARFEFKYDLGDVSGRSRLVSPALGA
jgi:hypothetical protein